MNGFNANKWGCSHGDWYHCHCRHSVWTSLYHPQHGCSKVMLSQVSVILFTGGRCVSQHALGQTPPSGQTPPCAEPPSWVDTPTPTPGRHHPHRADTPWVDTPLHTDTPRWPLQRTVRILLEYILVTKTFAASLLVRLYFQKLKNNVHV